MMLACVMETVYQMQNSFPVENFWIIKVIGKFGARPVPVEQ